MADRKQSPSSLSRRRLLQYGATLGGAAAMSSFVTVEALAAGKAKVNLQLGWLASNGIMGEVVAKRMGIYAEEGIELEVTPGGPGVDGVASVATGRAQGGQLSSSPSLMLVRSAGIPVKAFAAGYQNHAFTYFSLESNPIRTPQDMIGKTIATQPTAVILLRALLGRSSQEAGGRRRSPGGGPCWGRRAAASRRCCGPSRIWCRSATARSASSAARRSRPDGHAISPSSSRTRRCCPGAAPSTTSACLWRSAGTPDTSSSMRSRKSCWRWSVWRDVKTPCPTSCRAGCASGCPSPGRSSTGPGCCYRRLMYQDHSASMQPFFGNEMEAFKNAHKPMAISNTLAVLKRLLLRGVGIAFYTRLGFAEELGSGRLVAVPLEGERLSTLRLCLIAPSDRMPTVAARAVAEHLRQALAQFTSGLDREHER